MIAVIFSLVDHGILWEDENPYKKLTWAHLLDGANGMNYDNGIWVHSGHGFDH